MTSISFNPNNNAAPYLHFDLPQDGVAAVMAKARERGSPSWEFVRRIPQDEWDQVTEKIKELKPDLSDNDVRALKMGEWNHPIFRDKNWPYLAFYSYLTGSIDQKHIDKLFLYAAACKEGADPITKDRKNVYCCQLIDSKGNIDQENLDIVQPFLQEQFGKDLGPLLEHLKTLAPEETQCFILSPEKQPLLNEIVSWSQHLFSKNTDLMLVVPPHLLYEMYRYKFGANAMEPISILGFSPIEKLSDPKRRIVALPCPFITHSEKVHNKQTTPLEIYHHDIAYHLLIESANVHRKAWIELASVLKNNQKKFSKEAFNILFERTLDRDFRNYVSAKHPPGLTVKEKFWHALLTLYIASSKKKDLTRKTAQQAMQLFADHITLHQEEWQNKYGIYVQDSELLRKKCPPIFHKEMGELLTIFGHGSMMEKLSSFFES